MELGHSTCGYNFQQNPWPHYGGNFWSAKCSYIVSKQSPFNDKLIEEAQAANSIRPLDAKSAGGWPHDVTPYGRFYAEYWVLSPTVDAPHRIPMFHYSEPGVFSSVKDFFGYGDGHKALYTDGLSMYGQFQIDCCLNNLIMETIGQVVRGCELAGPTDVVVLPRDLDVGGGWRESLSVLHASAIDELRRVSLTHGCKIVTNAEATLANLPMKKYTDSTFVDHGPYLSWFYENMQLPDRLRKVQGSCYPVTLDGLPYTAIHMRIEDDWNDGYCREREKRPGGTQACFTPREIASTMDGVLDNERIVLIYGAPAPQFASGTGEHPLEVPWPSQDVFHKSESGDGCTSDLSLLSYNEKAFLDLWIAVKADRFIGHLASTLSNGATIARTSRSKGENYVYSCPTFAPLVSRNDGGEREKGTTDLEACRHAFEMPQ